MSQTTIDFLPETGLDEYDERKQILDFFYNNFYTEDLNGLIADQLIKIHAHIRGDPPLSLRQTYAAMKTMCASTIICDREELLDVLNEMDRRYFLANDLVWEFGIFDPTRKGSIAIANAELLFRLVHGEFFSQRKFNNLIKKRTLPEADISFAEIEVELCDIPTHDWMSEIWADEDREREELELRKKEEERLRREEEQRKKIEEEMIRKMAEEDAKKKEADRKKKLKEEAERKRREEEEAKQREEEKKRKEEEEKQRKLDEENQRILAQKAAENEKERLAREEEERKQKEKEEEEKRLREEEEARLRREAEEKAAEEKRLAEEKERQAEEERLRKEKEEQEHIAEEERKLKEEEEKKLQEVKEKMEAEEQAKRKNHAMENWKRAADLMGRHLQEEQMKALEKARAERDAFEAEHQEEAAEKAADAELQAELEMQKAEEELQNATDDDAKARLEEAKKKARDNAMKNKEKRLRLGLQAAVKVRKRPKIEAAIVEAEEAEEDIPSLTPDIKQAKGVSDSLKCGEELEDAMVSRDLAGIEAGIEKIKKNGYEKDHVTLLSEAEKLAAKLKRLERMKRELAALDQRLIAEIRHYKIPPPVVHQIMTAVYVLLGYNEKELKKWQYIQALLGRTGKESLKRMCTTLDATKLDLKLADVAESRYLKDQKTGQDLELDEVREISHGVATFFAWISATVEEARSWHQDAGKRKEIEEKRKQEAEEAKRIEDEKKKAMEAKRKTQGLKDPPPSSKKKNGTGGGSSPQKTSGKAPSAGTPDKNPATSRTPKSGNRPPRSNRDKSPGVKKSR